MLLLLLLCAPALLTCANTTDTQLEALAPTAGLLVSLLRKAEADRVIDRQVAERRHEVAEHRHEVAERRHEAAERRHESLLQVIGKAEADRVMDRQEAERRHEVSERRHEVSERRHEVSERRHESLLQSIGEISDAVVSAATAERVYACAVAGAVLLEAHQWAGGNKSKLCSATPLFSAQPQAESSHFLTSAHCFTNITRDGAAFSSAATLYYHTLMHTCTLVHHFFCHPSAPAACSAAAPSIDLAIVRCAAPMPVPSTRLSVMPQQHFQRAFIYGFSYGTNLNPELMYSGESSPSTSLHLKFARLAPSIQHPLPLDLTNVTVEQLLSSTTASAYTDANGAALPLASYRGFLDTVPEQGMSGGAVVDSQCGLLGVTESRSVFGEGGAFVKLSPSIVQRIIAAVGQL